tara:strand:- start:835 stop:1239 length:405 start_codon:yes stop_codon:yes gene_type:complete
MPLISMTPILQNTNNAVLNGYKAMPSKDITSNGVSNFSLGRMNYARGFQIMQPSFVASAEPQKKWIGRNQDASTITQARRITTIGSGTFNENERAMSFTAGNQVNTVNNALTRVRSQGSTVPRKVTGPYRSPFL